MLNGTELEQVHQYKYFGLLFDPTLKWETHTKVLCHKISKRGVFRRVRGYLDRRVSGMLYNALLLPFYDYCNVVVGNGKSGILTRPHRLQNRWDTLY